MKYIINRDLVFDVLNIKINKEIEFKNLGFVDSTSNNTLTYCNDEKYIPLILNNKNISGVFATSVFKENLSQNKITVIECEDPRFNFFLLYNYLVKKKYNKIPTEIHHSAKVHKNAFISNYNVSIGENTIVEPNASILPDVNIGKNCIIKVNTIIGSEGFEHKKTKSGVISVFHDGHVTLGDNVVVGANTCIDKGLSEYETIIEDYTKIENLVHIGHGVHIGKRCLIKSSSMIARSKIQNDSYIGQNSNISNNINIGSNSYISVGSLVTKDVLERQRVTGYFAVPHDKFLEYVLKLFRNNH